MIFRRMGNSRTPKFEVEMGWVKRNGTQNHKIQLGFAMEDFVCFNRMIHVTILCSHLKAICSGPGFQNWTVSFSVLLPEMLTACTGAAWTSCHTHPQWKLMWKWSKRTGSPDKSSTFWPLWCATNNTPPYHPIWHSHLTKQCRLWWTRAPSCSSFWGFMAT